MKIKGFNFRQLCLQFFIFTILPFAASSQNCTVNAGIDKTICPGTSLLLEGNIGGNYITPASVLWTQISGPNTATFNSTTSLSPTISNLIAGTYIFQIQTTCQIGGNATDQVSITVSTGATPVTHSNINTGCYTAGTPIALTGSAPPGHTLSWTMASNTAPVTGTFNGPTLSSFSGNNPTVQFPVPPSNWCSGSINDAVIKMTTTNIATGCTTDRNFYVSYRYNNTSVYAYVFPNPLCGTCANLSGSCAQGGTGTWTVIAAPGGAPPVTFSPNANSAIATACNLIPGTYTFRWTVTGSACTTGFADVTLPVTTGPSVRTYPVANSKYFCGGNLPSTISLEGNPPLYIGETVQWTQVGGAPVTIINPTSPFATATGLTVAGAPYMFKYAIFPIHGGCVIYDTMMVKVTGTIAYSAFGSTSCSISTYNSEPISSFYLPFYHSDSVRFTTIYESGPMPAVRIDITAFRNGLTALSSVHTTSQGSAASKIYTAPELWPNFTQSDVYISATLNVPGGNPCNTLVPGKYNFRVIIQDNCSTYVSQPFTSNIGKSDFITNAGSDQVLPCGSTSTTLAGNILNCAARPYWTTISKPAAAPDPINSGNMYNANVPLSGLHNGTYRFVWKADSGPVVFCPIKQDTVKITVASAVPAVPAITGGGVYCGNIPVNVSGALNDDAASGTWTVTTIPIGGLYTITPSLTSPNIVFTPGSLNTQYTLTWTVSNGCGTAQNSINITTTASTGTSADITNSNVCGAFGTSFGTLSATPAGGTWTSSNPNYTLVTPGSSSTTVSPTSLSHILGSVVFYYTINTSCGIFRDSVSFVNFNNPVISNASFCNIASFPSTQNVALSNLDPYAAYEVIGITGPGNPTLAQVSPLNFTPTGSSYNLSLTATQAGQYIILLRNRTGACNIGTYNITAQFSEPPPLAIAGPDINLCGTVNSIQLNAQPNPLGTGTGTWSVETIYSGSPPVFSSTNIPNPVVQFNNGGGDVLLRWRVTGSNLNCGGFTTDYLRIRYVAAANAGPDNYTCYFETGTTASMVLAANNARPGTGLWTIVSQPSGPSASFIDPSQHNTTIIGLQSGLYQLRWTITDPTGTCPVTSDDVFISVARCFLVPVKLHTFDAKLVNNDVNVSWKMETEEEGYKYILERAGIAQGPYQSIAFIDYDKLSNGNYTYKDEAVDRLGLKYIYYRLKILDKNGKMALSKIVVVRTQYEQAVNVFPTLLSKGQWVNIITSGNTAVNYDWTLVSATGQRINKGTVKSNSSVRIETSGLKAGIYLVQVSSSSSAQVFKITVN